MTLGVLVLARPTFDLDAARDAAAGAIGVIEATVSGWVGSREPCPDVETVLHRIGQMDGDTIDALVVLQSTFTDATMASAIAEAVDVPLVYWAFPEERSGGRLRLNSFCGVNLAAHALGRAGRPFAHLYCRSDDPTAPDQLLRALREPPAAFRRPAPAPDLEVLAPAAVAAADRIISTLAGTTLGVIGDYPDGFDPSRYDSGVVADRFGVIVQRTELDELFAAADAVDDATAVSIRERVDRTLSGVDELDPVPLDRSLRLYGGLRHLVDDHGWSGVATRCWPECFTEFGGAACAAQAMLTDDGVPGMCEADVYGNLTGLIFHQLSGGPSFVADMVDLDLTDDTAAFWHCGLAAAGLAEPGSTPHATIHSNRHVPLLHELALKPGRVTIARLSQAQDKHQLVIGGGEMLARPVPFSGSGGVARLDRPAAEVLDTIMTVGLEHHYGLGYGDHQEVLRALAARWELPVVELT